MSHQQKWKWKGVRKTRKRKNYGIIDHWICWFKWLYPILPLHSLSVHSQSTWNRRRRVQTQIKRVSFGICKDLRKQFCPFPSMGTKESLMNFVTRGDYWRGWKRKWARRQRMLLCKKWSFARAPIDGNEYNQHKYRMATAHQQVYTLN